MLRIVFTLFYSSPKKQHVMFNHVLSNIQWLHVIVAAIAYFALGAVWYSPALFSKQWVKLVNIDISDPNAKKGMGLLFAKTFILIIITSAGLAIFQQILPAIDALGGLKLGLLIGVTLVSTSISINYLYTKKPIALFLIDCGYHILGIAIASAIIAGWH